MYLTAPNLSEISVIRHGFFGRSGGVSAGIYASLNCGYGSNDEFELVSENRARVAIALCAKPESLCTVQQIHSPTALIVETPWEHKNAPEADALVTRKSGIVLGILTADCLPILFADGRNGVIAAAHAGWKGAVGGVIENTINKMEEIGAQRENIAASIGPAIAQSSYEVGAEFYDRFLAMSAENARFFCKNPPVIPAKAGIQTIEKLDTDFRRHDEGGDDKYLFNLPAYGKSRLERAGISQINIIAKDTCFNDNEFFSYRRSCLRGEPAYGRQLSAIVMV